MKSLIESYKELPNVKAIPDEVWDVQHILEDIAEHERKIIILKSDLERTLPKMMEILRRDWSRDELVKVGLMNERRRCKCARPVGVVSSPIDTVETCRNCGGIIP